ncbi:MAG: hypothetical protein ACON4H_03580 [Rubripirellula sp.]
MLTAVKLCLTVALICQPISMVWAIASLSGGCQVLTCTGTGRAETTACGCCRTQGTEPRRGCCSGQIEHNEPSHHQEIEEASLESTTITALNQFASVRRAERTSFQLVSVTKVLEGECHCSKANHQPAGLPEGDRQQDERHAPSCDLENFFTGGLKTCDGTACSVCRVCPPQHFVQKQFSVWHL